MLWTVHISCSRFMLSLKVEFKMVIFIYKPIIRAHSTEFNDKEAHNMPSWSRYSNLHAQIHHFTATSYQQHNPIMHRFSSFTQNTRWLLINHILSHLIKITESFPGMNWFIKKQNRCTSAHSLYCLSLSFPTCGCSLLFLLLNNQISTHLPSHLPIRFLYPFFIYPKWTRANE